MHYLDYNATSPLRPGIKDDIYGIMELPLNASSVHSYGRKAKHILETARKTIAQTLNIGLTGTPSAHVIFTCSGTEANNLALRAFKNAQHIITATEHPSIMKAATNPQIINVNNDGIISLEQLEQSLKACDPQLPILVSVMFANNETGILQPIKDIIHLAKQYNALVHSDAVQAYGKIPIDMTELDIDMLTISSHKIGGPQGAAALLIRKNVPYTIEKQLHGGGQEFGFRAGTENIAAIHGFALAAKIATSNLETEITRLSQLQQQLEHIITSYAPNAVIIGTNTERLPNTSCICLPNVKSETQLIHFDLAKIAVSTGSACSSGKVENSHVLAAMGYPKDITACALRISTGFNTTDADIEACITQWKKLYDNNRKAA